MLIERSVRCVLGKGWCIGRYSVKSALLAGDAGGSRGAMCSYDSGEVHRYSLQSTMKLRPSLQARKDLAANVREALSAGCDENQNRNKQTHKSKQNPLAHIRLRHVVGRKAWPLLQPGDATLDAQWLFLHPTALELSAIVLRNVTYTPPKDAR
jgi:hypothetical protein